MEILYLNQIGQNIKTKLIKLSKKLILNQMILKKKIKQLNQMRLKKYRKIKYKKYIKINPHINTDKNPIR